MDKAQSKPKCSTLLSFGLLPEEFRDIFCSKSLGELFNKNSQNFLDKCVNKDINKLSPCSIKLARPGNSHRILGIPNPIPYTKLSKLIEDEWDNIHPKLSSRREIISRVDIPVTPNKETRALKRKYHFSVLDKEKLKLRHKGQYILIADIEKFYPNIYTHAIDWALRGKEEAKKNPTDNSLGARLDKHIRDCQDGQTNGILIGPDVSFLAGEIILSKIDEKLRGYNYIRMTDDFHFICKDQSEASEIFSKLETELEKFNLRLNNIKSGIFELPYELQSEWTTILSKYRFDNESKNRQREELFNFFDDAFRYSKKFKFDSVLRFALGKLNREFADIKPANRKYLFRFALSCARVESGTLKQTIRLINKVDKIDFLSDEEVGETLNRIIIEKAPLNHSSDVVWALYAFKKFNLPHLKVADESVEKLKKSSDCLSILLAMELSEIEKIQKNLTTGEPWNHIFDNPRKYREYWILHYQALLNGWTNLKANSLGLPLFTYMKDNKVTFLDTEQ